MVPDNHNAMLNSVPLKGRHRLFLLLSVLIFLLSASLGLLLVFSIDVEPKDVLVLVLVMCLPAVLGVLILLLGEHPWSGRIIFCLFLGYYSLFVGFAYLRIEVGLPIYIGELSIFFIMLLMRHRREAVMAFVREPVFWFALFWIVSALPSLSTSIVIHPVNSLRNFSPAYYTVFIYFGYIFMLGSRNPLAIWRTYGRVISLVLLYYGLMLPVRHALVAISPESAPGTPLLGTFVNGYSYGIVFGAWGLILAPHFTKYVRWTQLASLVVMCECVVITQARSGYLQMLLLAILLWVLRGTFDFRRLRIPVAIGLLVLAFVIVGASGFGMHFSGDKGPISTRFYAVGTLSIFGAHSSDYRNWEQTDTMVGSAYGRVDWWQDVVEKVFETVPTSFFGLGFEQPLGAIPGISLPVIFMNAHGTFVTVLGRFGLMGLFACLGILFYTIYLLVISIRRQTNPTHRAIMAWLIIAISLFTFAGIWGTWFDAPNHAISFYLLIGFALGYLRKVKLEEIDLGSLSAEQLLPKVAP